MASQKLVGGERRQGRLWTFANCSFDEDEWALQVDGKRVSLEAKPTELLHELLLNAGKVVTKGELLDRIWPDVIVVEASLPTAVRKLRLALGGGPGGRNIVETVAGIGYRLAAEVQVERRSARSGAPEATVEEPPAGTSHAPRTGRRGFPRVAPMAVGAAVLCVAVLALGVGASRDHSSNAPARLDRLAVKDALRELDIPRVAQMLRQGWNPDMSFDDEGTTPLTYVLQMCEWDRAHDRRRMMMMVRTLIENGASIDRPNFWGDTAYSIAKAPRYCGPNHPATRLIRSACYDGLHAPGDRCLATYELARRQGRTPPAHGG